MMDLNFNFKHKNEVRLIGQIVHVFDTGKNGRMIVTLDVSRKNFPKVLIWGKLAEKVKALPEDYAVVSIVGNIQHSYRDDGISYMIFGTELEVVHPKTLYQNEFQICGNVRKIYEFKNKTVIYVNTLTNSHFSVVPLTIYSTDTRLLSFEYGQPITGMGKIVSKVGNLADGSKTYGYEYVADFII